MKKFFFILSTLFVVIFFSFIGIFLIFFASPYLYKKLTQTRLELGIRGVLISIYVPYNREVTVLRSDLELKISSNAPKKSQKRLRLVLFQFLLTQNKTLQN